MSRIGATLSGTERMLLNRLAEANAAATLNTLRLAAAKKVNAPADDPAAFMAISQLESRLALATATAANVTAASSMITQAQSVLDEIRTQLGTIRTELLTDEDRDLTAAQRSEAQATIDSAIDEINSLASTSIDGHRLLDGSADFAVSGRNSSQVAGVTVHATVYGATQTISGSVTQTAGRAELTYTGAGGQTTAAATFTLTGELGNASITVTSGEDLDDVAQRMNDQSHNTGVTAESTATS